MTPIEEYAKMHLNIHLTVFQMECLRRWSVGASITAPKRSGVSTAKKVYYRYMQYSTGSTGKIEYKPEEDFYE